MGPFPQSPPPHVLDLHRIQDQFPAFSAYHAQEQARRAGRLRRALAVLRDDGADWESLAARLETARPPWLVAGLREAPAAVHVAGPRPTPVTVVATDGSQIYPDRHVEPTCYLLNISRIAFHYGTLERPLMEAVPQFRYRREEVDDLHDELLETATAEVVSAIRDEYELRALLETAERVRLPGRPLVALADGTLIRWMLRGLRDRELEAQLIARYTELLAHFREAGLPLASYISLPGNTEVVNLLRVQNGETEATDPASPESLSGLTDRHLFEAVLGPGERSAVFESASHIQREYGVDRICYFYLDVGAARGGREIGRVEMPAWVADDERLVDLLHAVVLSECEKGDGYPMILSEAHERAVIRAHEKACFYELIERQLRQDGLPFTRSHKEASKRRPRV